MSGSMEFSEQIARLVREVRAESNDSEAALRAITKAAVTSVPGAEYASITMVTDGEIETPVMVGDIAGASDELQQRYGEGPCIRAAVDDATIWISDMRNETRWPKFSVAAAELGISSMICFCLYIEGSDFGALNLHSTRIDAFDDEARMLGQLFAAHAATVYSAVREKEQLRIALGSRDIIGQAKGMIMERYRLDADAAFRLLARLSQDANTKLVDVAAQIVIAGPDGD